MDDSSNNTNNTIVNGAITLPIASIMQEKPRMIILFDGVCNFCNTFGMFIINLIMFNLIIGSIYFHTIFKFVSLSYLWIFILHLFV